MKKIIKRWCVETDAATAVEYALMVAGVTILILISVFSFGDNVANMFEDFSDWIS